MKQNNQPSSSKNSVLSGSLVVLLDILLAAVLIGALVLFYNSLLFSRVQGNSMEPTYKNSDFLLCSRKASPDRFDIVYFHAGGAMLGDQETTHSLRRVIALPGETVAILDDGTVTVNGQPLEEPYLDAGTKEATCRGSVTGPLTLGENEYFVLGDSRAAAKDSRDYGALSGSAIQGLALRTPNITVYTLTIVAPLCAALALFWLLDQALRRRIGK